METNDESVIQALVTVATETFRVSMVFNKALSKLDAEDRQRYSSQFSWFLKRVTTSLERAGITLVSLEGSAFEPGDAIVPLNINDFTAEDPLIIQQMIEPIVMCNGSVLKSGTALLERTDEK